MDVRSAGRGRLNATGRPHGGEERTRHWRKIDSFSLFVKAERMQPPETTADSMQPARMTKRMQPPPHGGVAFSLSSHRTSKFHFPVDIDRKVML